MLTSKYTDYWVLVTLAEKVGLSSFEIKLHVYDVYGINLRLKDLYENLDKLLTENYIFLLGGVADRSEPFGALALTDLGRQVARNRHEELELIARSIILAGQRSRLTA